MQTERVTFLTSPEHKAALDSYAASSGQSVGNVVREATSLFIGKESERAEEAELAALIVQLAKAVPEMRASLKRTTRMLDDTSREVDQMLREAGVRK